MSQPFRATVVTPEAMILETEIREAQIPGHDGLVGILNLRAPLLTKLGTGVLKLITSDGEKKFLVQGGYAQVKDNTLTILTDQAIAASQITGEQAQAELTKATALTITDEASLQRREKALAKAKAMAQLAS